MATVNPRLTHDPPPELGIGPACALRFVRLLLSIYFPDPDAPAGLLALGRFTRAARTGLLLHFRWMEDLMRKLLVIEALTLARKLVLPPPAKARNQQRDIQRPQAELDPTDSTRWPATFLTLKPDARPRPRRKGRVRPASPPSNDFDARPLALRAEALIRAAADPMPYIRRLARRFARRLPSSVALLFFTPTTPFPAVNEQMRELDLDGIDALHDFHNSS